MNKKNLSVVMAGAMLATSVAPVLAAETTTQKDYTVNNSNKGLLIKELRNLIESKTFANVSDNAPAGMKNYAGKSVHYVQRLNYENTITVGASYTTLINLINTTLAPGNNLPTSVVNESLLNNLKANEETTVLESATDKITVKLSAIKDQNAKAVVKHYQVYDNSNISALENAIQKSNNGDVFEAWDRGYREVSGKYYAYSKDMIADTFTKEGLKEAYNKWESNKGAYKAVLEMSLNDDETKLTVKTRTVLNETEDSRVVYTYEVGSEKVDFTQPVDGDNKVLLPDTDGFVTSKDLAGFAKVYKDGSNVDYDIPEKKLATITISDVDKSYTAKLSDLYDGLFLTENGQKLLDEMKKYDADKDDSVVVSSINTASNGLYTLDINFTNKIVNGKTEKYVVTVTTNNKEQLELFKKWMDQRKAQVEVLAGSNRYETAVKVAKENADITTVAKNGNIVLVNGNSLVDGLAAAPLAASVKNLGDNGEYPSGTDYVAPILLTDANGIPKATKDYMKELIATQEVGKLNQVTVYLVGGEAVISKSVENDLKEIGFRVVRAGGADREETSLEVAELMAKEGNTNINGHVGLDSAFLVGANGEADAMSIAPVAAANRTPIIVESVHGISEDTVEYFEGYKNNGLKGKNVTIVGGETAVSATTEGTLKDAKLSVQRVAGSNRQATNAKIINTYYGKQGMVNGVNPINPGYKFDNVLVSKDGIQNKSELIDALTATSIAVKHESPIVLGTSKLSKDQINALEINANRDGVYVYQVGIGVARDVVKTIAERVGLAK